MCTIRPIRNENDYLAAVHILTSLWSEASESSYQLDQLEVWGALIDYHEQTYYPPELPDPIEALKFHIEEQGMLFTDLSEVFESLERARAVLEKRERLSLEEVWKLYNLWKIPAESLIKPYALISKI